MSFRIATFNLQNFRVPDPEEVQRGEAPSLEKRIRVLRPRLRRLEADILCLQEVFSEETEEGRTFEALKRLFEGTRYSSYSVHSTETEGGKPYLERNLLIVSRPEVTGLSQYRYDKIPPPRYDAVTDEDEGDTTGEGTEDVGAGRPFLHAEIDLDDGHPLHVINVHLKSRAPTDIPSQKAGDYAWASAAGWAEGYFLSSMKRVGQALEVRFLLDELFDEEEDPNVVVAGDFNAPPGEVPVEAIIGRVRDTGNPDLVEEVLVPLENSIPEPSRYTYLYHGEKRLLDHMLISRPLVERYRGASIHNEILHDESLAFSFNTKFPASDHAPFVATFDFPNGGSG
jgi:predicted extracellular nuclease